MCQRDIFNLMKGKRKWFTNKEIASKVGVSYGSVTVSTKKLVKANFLEMKEGRLESNRPTLYFRYKTGKIVRRSNK
jgi:predicted transcriptional regulator